MTSNEVRELGIVGLGRMGANIARRVMRAGHRCVVYDVREDAVRAVAEEGAAPAASLAELVEKLSPPRAVWVMLPAGEVTGEAIDALGELLLADDTIIDGGNSYYRDDVRRAAALAPRGIHFVDCGTSGGVWGLERGYCLMIGGEAEVVSRLRPIFAALAPGCRPRRGHRPVAGRRLMRSTAFCTAARWVQVIS